VVSTAGRQITGLLLENNPPQMTEITLQNVSDSEHLCISLFRDKKGEAHGFAVGGLGGQVAFKNFDTPFPKLVFFTVLHYNSSLLALILIISLFIFL